MENNPELTTAPSALDKVAAALAELGQETAAAIAQRAGVGYSTATKRLRLLEEAGQAEAFHAGDGRTFWRQAASPGASADRDDALTTTTNGDGEPPSMPAPTEDGAEEPSRSDESPAPPQETSAAVAAEPAGIQLAPADPLRQGGGPNGPAAPDTDAEATGDASLATAGVEDPVVAPVGDEAEATRGPDPASTTPSTAASGQAEAANPSTGGNPRRPKGTLRGAILDVFEAHPGQPFKTSQLCQAIDKADEGSGSARASAGAVVNAAHKLVADGLVVQVVEKPAAFQLTPTTA